MKKKLIGSLVGITLLSGCATIMNGDMVDVPVYTTPSGATVVINGATYTSPTTVMVPRGKGDFKLHIKKEGYEPVDIMLTQSHDGWLWGNILFGGLIGLAVDFMSGDAYDLHHCAQRIACHRVRTRQESLPFSLPIPLCCLTGRQYSIRVVQPHSDPVPSCKHASSKDDCYRFGAKGASLD